MKENKLSLNEFKIEQFFVDLQDHKSYVCGRSVTEKTLLVDSVYEPIWVSTGSYGYSVSIGDNREFFSDSYDAAGFCARILHYFEKGGKRTDIDTMRIKHDNEK